MTAEPRKRIDSILRFFVTALIFATCVRVWTGPLSVAPTAQAQIPNAGAQRMELVDQVRQTNVLIAQILRVLDTATFKVEIAGTDKPIENKGVPLRGRSQ